MLYKVCDELMSGMTLQGKPELLTQQPAPVTFQCPFVQHRWSQSF